MPRRAIVAEVRADYERIRAPARGQERARTAASDRRGARNSDCKTDWAALCAARARNQSA